MSQAMGLREFGRMVGLSGEGVRKAVRTGRIPESAMGVKALKSGREVPYIADVDLAHKALGVNTNSDYQRDKQRLSDGAKASIAVARSSSTKAKASVKALPISEPKSFSDSGDDSNAGATANGQRLPTITESNQKIAYAKSQMAILKLQEERGKLVSADQVKVRTVNMIRAAVNKIRGVPTKAKGRMPHLSLYDIELLEEMLDEALKELSGGG